MYRQLVSAGCALLVINTISFFFARYKLLLTQPSQYGTISVQLPILEFLRSNQLFFTTKR